MGCELECAAPNRFAENYLFFSVSFLGKYSYKLSVVSVVIYIIQNERERM